MKRYNICDMQKQMIGDINRPMKKQKQKYDSVSHLVSNGKTSHCGKVKTSMTDVKIDSERAMKVKNDCISVREGELSVLIFQCGDSSDADNSVRYFGKVVGHAMHCAEEVDQRCRNYCCMNKIDDVVGEICINKITETTKNHLDKEECLSTAQSIQNKAGYKTTSIDKNGKNQIYSLRDRKINKNDDIIAIKTPSFWKLIVIKFWKQLRNDYLINEIKILVHNFIPERMLGIQNQRGNTICLSRIVFKTGIKLYQLGYTSKAMLLYDTLLVKLLCISRDEKSDNNDDIQQEKCQQEPERNAIQIRSLYQESLDSFLVVYPRMVSTLKKLGIFHLSINNVTMALDCFETGNLINEVLMRACYSNMIEALMNIALIHRRNNDFALALTQYIQVYFLQWRVYGPRSLECATSLSLIALMQYRLKQYSSAYEMYHESLIIQVDLIGGGNIGVASTVNSLGLCCFYLRSFKRAKLFFIRSLKIRQEIQGCDHYDLAIIWYNIGTICVESGDEIEAIKCYNESLRIEEIAIEYDKYEGAILALKNLGYIYQRNGEIDDAAHHFRRALELQQKMQGDDSDTVGKIYNILGNIHLQKGNITEMMECYTYAARCFKRTNETMLITGYTFYCLSKHHPQCANAA